MQHKKWVCFPCTKNWEKNYFVCLSRTCFFMPYNSISWKVYKLQILFKKFNWQGNFIRDNLSPDNFNFCAKRFLKNWDPLKLKFRLPERKLTQKFLFTLNRILSSFSFNNLVWYTSNRFIYRHYEFFFTFDFQRLFCGDDGSGESEFST